MKILIMNKFLVPKGGPETYTVQIGDCLEQMGHDAQYFGVGEPGRIPGNRINRYTLNMDFHIRGFGRLAYPLRVLYSKETRQKLTRVPEDFRPDTVHISNFNYQLAPSILYGIRGHERRSGKRAAVLCMAHDYQLICSDYILSSPGDGQNCELCVDGYCVSCVRKRCVHLSMAKSPLGAAEGMVYRKPKVYQYISRVIYPGYLIEEKMNHVDLFRDRIITIHNFAVRGGEVPGVKRDHTLCFGRYSREEGIRVLFRACRKLPNIPLVLTGAGLLEDRIRGVPNIKNLGFVEEEGLNRLIREVRLSIYPPEYHKDYPFSAIKSQLLRTPVPGARVGGIPGLIQEGVNGTLFTSGDLGNLKEKIKYLWDRPQLYIQWSDRCRDIPYGTMGAYYSKLLELYGADREG